MAGQIRGRLENGLGALVRQCMSVGLAVTVVVQPVWAAGPVPPQLSSKPGAAYTLFLNFSGFTWNQAWGGGPTPGVVPTYNSDGDEATFSGTEMTRIHEIWSRTSEKYAAFDVNITTVDPATAGLSDYDRQVYYGAQPRFMHTVIGGGNSWIGSGTGVSYIDVAEGTESPTNASYKMNWVFPTSQIGNNSQGIAEIIAHENGHALGLWHQSDFDVGPVQRSNYSDGTSGTAGSYGPIMGASRGVTRGLWSRGWADIDTWNGSAWVSTPAEVNEIGTMLTINSGFTVVDDGIGHTQVTATPIKAINGTIDYTSAKGMITTVSGNTNPDPTNAAHYTNDFWSFTTTGGNVTLNVMSGRSTMNPGVADPGKTLDAKLTLYDSLGVEVATTTYGASLDATLTQNLAAGTYYAKVSPTLGPNGTGEVDTTYGLSREFFDIGSYFVTGTIPGLNSEVVRYWDNTGGNGFGNAGGTWSASTSSQWNTDSTGAGTRGSNVIIAALDAVHFGTDSVGLGAGAVNVSGTVAANRITFGAASGNITLSGGTITLASVAPTVTVNNATSTIASVVAGNAGIVKAGTGTLVLSGANTLIGSTTINGGTLSLTGNGSLSDVSAVNTSASGTRLDISGITAASESVGSIAGVAGSTIMLGGKNLTVQGSTSNAAATTFAGVISGAGGSFTKTGAENLTLSGNNTFTGGVTAGGGTLTLTGNNTFAGGATISGGTLSFNNVGLINTSGNITFTAAGRLQWNGHAQDLSSRIVMTNGSNATIDTNNQNVTFASALGNSSTAAFTKAGGGMLTLGAASTYNGTTTANGGVLVLNHASALPGGIGATGGTSALTFTGGVLGLGVGDFTRNLATAGTVTGVNFTNAGGWAAYNADRIVNLNNDGHEIVWATAGTGFNGQTVILGSTTATHKVTLQNGINLGTATRTVQAENGAAAIDGELSGVITGGAGGGLTKSGGGTLALTNTNTYTGVTTVNGGTLQVSLIADGGNNSNIGASSNATASLVLTNNGMLRYTGPAVSTDRGFTLSGNAGIDASGVGAITFATTATPAFGTANQTRTLTLTGTNTGNNTLAANLANNGTGAVSLTKTGTGTWVVSGSNTNTGTTTVSTGTLVVSGSGSINSSSAITVSAGARLVYNSSTPLTRAPTLAGSAGNAAVLSGNGTINVALTLDSLDDVLSPGNSPGEQSYGTSQTWDSFTYAWEVNDWSNPVEGTTFDGIDITGGLTLSGSSYGLDLFSLTSLNALGDLSNFSEVSRSWTILSTTTGISGFLVSEWNIDDSGFTAGSLPGGTWSLGLANGGNDLLLSYAPVPEPGSIALVIAGLAAAWQLRRRSRIGAGG